MPIDNTATLVAITAAPSSPLALHYTINASQPHSHLYEITLQIENPQAGQQVSLPVWIPGSYLVREFARHLQRLGAEQDGQTVAVDALAKNRWKIDCKASVPVTLRYQVYAFDHSVRAAWLDTERAFFNPTSLCLQVAGQEHLRHGLRLLRPAHASHWRLATALPAVTADDNGFGNYLAENYDHLADSPVEMGDFQIGSFDVLGIPHRFAVAGAPPSFDAARLFADTQAICETAMRFWHPQLQTDARGIVRHGHYLFLLNAVASGYGGLEHRYSTALICNRGDLPRHGQGQGGPTSDAAMEGYRTLLGLISHEYFHTWNVKRLRPLEFAHYDYDRENHTQLLWFFEGFTSYYDDLLLRRAGLLSDEQYLQLLAKTIHQVEQTPGRTVQSVAEASFDAWTKYYRQEENTANSTVSYYTKGALVALCLDLKLREEGKTTLDAVMRQLWEHSQGGPVSEADILAALEQLSGRSWQQEVQDWVHGTDALPLERLLSSVGVTLTFKAPDWMQRLGILVQENTAVLIRRIQSGSVAEQAGFAVGDEWLGLRITRGGQHSEWRIQKLEDLDTLLPRPGEENDRLQALVARDGRLHWLTLNLPATGPAKGQAQLCSKDSHKTRTWLDPQSPEHTPAA